MKKFKFVAGLAVGYVLGSRAGRDRYEQIVAAARKAQTHPAVTQAQQKAKQLLAKTKTSQANTDQANTDPAVTDLADIDPVGTDPVLVATRSTTISTTSPGGSGQHLQDLPTTPASTVDPLI